MYTKQASNLNYRKPKTVNLSDGEYDRSWEEEKAYKPIKKLNDPRFGEVTVVKNPTSGRVLFLKEKIVTGKSDATDELNNLRERSDLNHPNILPLVNYTSQTKKELCSTNYIIKAYYDFPKTDVYKEEIERRKNVSEFTHLDLTHMVYQSLNGLDNIHSRGYAHGDIRPQMIGYDRSINNFTLLDRLGDPTNFEKCQSNNIINKKDLFMSPELYNKLKGKKKVPVDAQKNDIFSLGMTILQTGNHESVRQVYNSDGTINQFALNEKVMDFDNRHAANNPFLCNIVKTLLQQDMEDRPTIKELKESMPSYVDFKKNEAEGVNYNIAPKPPVEYKPETTHVNANPNYVRTYVQNETRVESTPNTYTYHHSYANTYQNYQESRVVNSQPVEVRRGNPDPTPGISKVVKKKYVLRSDGTMVELDPQANLNTTEISKHFDKNYNEHVVDSNVKKH